ncbi:hypothetical protein TIFTF001_045355 [Ficus carica]|uniref:Uncharacterized protein n=1 Tax=Ficus carica TaxID=3494 RepID=A0AA88CK19_FICCA|nr:hypothetical protein TIFTF001_045355 [Ficus carica]
MVYSYRHVPGFAATLTSEQVKAMKNKDEVLSVRKERTFTPQTTHSPQFLGLNKDKGLWRDSKFGEGVIIGVLDSGIVSGHPSFDDTGMPPPPARWKGTCQPINGTKICNNKIIGSRSFISIANGTAAGMSPALTWRFTKSVCQSAARRAGLDSAIGDGVDKGIFVSCAAGNGGPYLYSVSNVAPWMLTVEASTMDRSLRAGVNLGNWAKIRGESIIWSKRFDSKKSLPLAFPRRCGFVLRRRFTHHVDLEGKIVLFDRSRFRSTSAQVKWVKNGGGIAMILTNRESDGFSTMAEAHILHVIHVIHSEAFKLKAYFNSASKPEAKLTFKGTSIGGNPYVAPMVASLIRL